MRHSLIRRVIDAGSGGKVSGSVLQMQMSQAALDASAMIWEAAQSAKGR